MKLRLMKAEECAGHTIEYAMGWKACIEWIKNGGDEQYFEPEQIEYERDRQVNDLISREALIDAVESIDWYHINNDGELVNGARSDEGALYKAEDIYKAIEDAPPVKPKRGEWTRLTDGVGMHKECGFIGHTDDNYCGGCGADMKGATDETD